MLFVGINYFSNYGVTNNISGRETDKSDPLNSCQGPLRLDQALGRPLTQIHLGRISGDHSAGPLAQARQKHEHLLAGRILGLIKDHK